MPDLQIQLLSPKLGDTIPLPQYETPGAAGLDLRACIDAPITLSPGALVLVPTGLAIALPSPSYVALLFARSGLAARHGIALSNGVGVIDSDYRGEIKVALTNLSQTPYEVKPGDRICQLAVLPVAQATLSFVSHLTETQRGQGGFGSTGRA
jgi:dUTP pyrophosphatase